MEEEVGKEEEKKTPMAGWRLASLVALLVVLLCAAWANYRIYVTRPQFLKMYKEMNMELPAATRIMFLPWVPLLVPSLALIAIIKELAVRDKRVTFAANALLAILIQTVLMIYAEAVFRPLIDFMGLMSS